MLYLFVYHRHRCGPFCFVSSFNSLYLTCHLITILISPRTSSIIRHVTMIHNTKKRYNRCTASLIFKLVTMFTLLLLAVSIFVTFSLTTSVKFNSSASHQQERQIDSPLVLEKERIRDSTNAKANSLRQTASTKYDNTSYEEALVQWIATQKQTTVGASTSIQQLLSTPIYFLPGSLPISQLSTLQHCYTNPTIYNQHLKSSSPRRRVPYSERYQLAYILLPKSGSSTGRFMMKTEFQAVEQTITLQPPLNVIAFVREPLSRFYSQYDEAYVRTAPWQKTQNEYSIDESTGDYVGDPHPYPYLHEGLSTYHDYEDVFCPPETRKNKNSRRECLFRESHENGTLASRLERFVQEYDGLSPFDVHLIFQVPMLSNRDGYAMYITELYNTTNSKQDWNDIAKKYLGESGLSNAKKESGGVIEGRSYPRRFDKSLVGKQTERRICELALIDYCCLNFPLPASCGRGGDGEEEKRLTCKMEYDEKAERIRVQPGVFPERVG